MAKAKDTIRRMLYQDLDLVKKSACWVPTQLNEDQNKDRLGKRNDLLELIWSIGLSVQDKIVTMDKSAVSLHTLENIQQWKQWIKKKDSRVLLRQKSKCRGQKMDSGFI
jgi:hypothetical protein